MNVEASADWCESDGTLAICGTRMTEYARSSMGQRWCFTCRRRHNFERVVMVPDGLSYYGPHAEIRGVAERCTDLFPGWTRERDE